MAKSLRPPKQICVNVPRLFLAMVVFAIMMFYLGWWGCHYPMNGGLI